MHDIRHLSKGKTMTMPHERTRAVLCTRDFLESIARPSSGVPEAIRFHAQALLRHYPTEADLDLTCKAFPLWWEMPATRTPP
jgi:hypothetical protein